MKSDFPFRIFRIVSLALLTFGLLPPHVWAAPSDPYITLVKKLQVGDSKYLNHAQKGDVILMQIFAKGTGKRFEEHDRYTLYVINAKTGQNFFVFWHDYPFSHLIVDTAAQLRFTFSPDGDTNCVDFQATWDPATKTYDPKTVKHHPC